MATRSSRFLGASLALFAVVLVIPGPTGSAGSHPASAEIPVAAPAAAATVSLTFDDGYASAVTTAAPLLAKHGLSGTAYVVPTTIGTRARLTWRDLRRLRQTFGWEIGSHALTHTLLSPLAASQVRRQLVESKRRLASHGLRAQSFASPSGDYNNAVLAEIAKHYTSHRGYKDNKRNVWPYSDYLLNVLPLQRGVSVPDIKAAIDLAVANNDWLILVMHDIKSRPTSRFDFSATSLRQIATYIRSRIGAGVLRAANVSQVRVSGVNLLPNGTFATGFEAGWHTDSPSAVMWDAGDHGSIPEPTHSVKLTSSQRNVHLFSPQIEIDPTGQYVIKSFLNVASLVSGEVGFFIDEYASNGDWLSGQYRASEHSRFVERLNFSYRPSSTAVQSASLQVIVTAESDITAYVDNIEWLRVG